MEAATKPSRPTLDQRQLNPHGSLQKRISMPGYNGVPFRGTPPFLKDEDDPAKQPKTAYQVYADIFDLSIPEDLAYYGQVWQLAANGYVLISADERKYDEEKKNWRVFLRWAQPYTYAPENFPHG